MDEDIKKLLKENIEISRESLKILKGIRRGRRLATAFKVFYWLVILGSLVGAYYYFQPLIQSTIGIIQQAINTISSLQKVGGTLQGQGTQGLSPDILKNLPPDLLKKIQDMLKTQ